MLGAIAGDIVGSVYENLRTKKKDFRLFTPLSIYTDDTVLTVAIADALLSDNDYGRTIKSYARRHPLRGYGPKFMLWMLSPSTRPYNSLGNGSAMRVSPVAHAFGNEREMLEQAKRSAECTHNHPEGIKGAQATALAIFMARNKASKQDIREAISTRYGYDLSRRTEDIRPGYRISLTCPGSVPEAIIAFLDSDNFEDAIRNAVSLGGDADTQAAIAGAIAEAFYGDIPIEILNGIAKRLNGGFKLKIVEFYKRFGTQQMVEQSLSLVRETRGGSRAGEA
ncbi:MAG: ADP-ribosylglycohydrolase family protein [candidate division NC10 bacterium]|nr:ADP-ribosylglycohydrolase family protein [candidate division NC10 bacterium]